MKPTIAAILVALLVSTASALAADDSDKCEPPAGTRSFGFSSGDNKLRGFIDVPAEDGPFPAVLVPHGSGDTDIFSGNSEYNGHYDRLRDTFRAAGGVCVRRSISRQVSSA